MLQASDSNENDILKAMLTEISTLSIEIEQYEKVKDAILNDLVKAVVDSFAKELLQSTHGEEAQLMDLVDHIGQQLIDQEIKGTVNEEYENKR